MPLYFFRLMTERGVTQDPIGVEFASLADAIADAKLTRIEYFEMLMLFRRGDTAA